MTTSNKLQIIGAAGNNGAGKDTVGELLADDLPFLYLLLELLRAEARRRGLPVGGSAAVYKRRVAPQLA